MVKLETALNAQQSIRAEQIKKQLNKIEGINTALLYGQLKQEQEQLALKKLKDKIFKVAQFLQEINLFKDNSAKYWALKCFNNDYLPYAEIGLKDLEDFKDKEYVQKIINDYKASVSSIPLSVKEECNALWDELKRRTESITKTQIEKEIAELKGKQDELKKKLIAKGNHQKSDEFDIERLKKKVNNTGQTAVVTGLFFGIMALITWALTGALRESILVYCGLYLLLIIRVYTVLPKRKQILSEIILLQEQIEQKKQQENLESEKISKYKQENLDPFLSKHPEFDKYVDFHLDFLCLDLDLSVIGVTNVEELKALLKQG